MLKHLVKIQGIKNLFRKIIFSLMVHFCIIPSLFAMSEGIQFYQKNLHLSPYHKQKLANDIIRYRNADNLWDVLRDEFSLIHYEEHPAVQEKIDWFMNNQGFLIHSATRAAPYLYYILQQVKLRHLPIEVVLLPIIESGYNPFNVSSVGAAGIWQLMPGTASGLGVKQDWWYDGRRDVIASTRAALNHLAYLQNFFGGDWLLAFAAYDTGEGNVQSAIRKNIRLGRDTDFWSLPLALETRNYVPSLLALATIISHPDQYPVYFPPVRNAPYLAVIDIGTQINMKYAATLAGLSYKKILQLNPGFRQIHPGRGPSKLVLPIENVEQFSENLARSPYKNIETHWIHYRVRPGDTLLSITRKFNVTVASLKNLNHFSKQGIHPGNNILIPKQTSSIIAMHNEPSQHSDEHLPSLDNWLPKIKKPLITHRKIALASNHYNYRLQPGDTVYMVRENDSLDSIAKRFHFDVQLLQIVNQLPNTEVIAGKKIIIPTHNYYLDNTKNIFVGKIKPGDTLYMVRRGDTIEKIANKYHTSATLIRLSNTLDDRTLHEGEQILVPARWHS